MSDTGQGWGQKLGPKAELGLALKERQFTVTIQERQAWDHRLRSLTQDWETWEGLLSLGGDHWTEFWRSQTNWMNVRREVLGKRKSMKAQSWDNATMLWRENITQWGSSEAPGLHSGRKSTHRSYHKRPLPPKSYQKHQVLLCTRETLFSGFPISYQDFWSH